MMNFGVRMDIYGYEKRTKRRLCFLNRSFKMTRSLVNERDSCGTLQYKPRCEKTGLRGFRTGPT